MEWCDIAGDGRKIRHVLYISNEHLYWNRVAKKYKNGRGIYLIGGCLLCGEVEPIIKYTKNNHWR
jgi:hypothetical protein